MYDKDLRIEVLRLVLNYLYDGEFDTICESIRYDTNTRKFCVHFLDKEGGYFMEYSPKDVMDIYMRLF